MQPAYDRTPPAYDRNMQPAYDAYDRMQAAYAHMHCSLHTSTYDRMQAAFFNRMQAACVASVAPALHVG